MVVIDTKGIKGNLLVVEEEYSEAMQSPDVRKGGVVAALCSKLAIIEVSGWIEITIDRMLKNYLNMTLTDIALRSTVEKDVIDRVYGFHYRNEVRPLFEKIIGAARFAKIVGNLKRRNSDQAFFSLLGEIARMRDSAAHTYWHEGITQHYDSPSVVRQKFEQLLPILSMINGYVKYFARRSKHQMP